MTIQKKHNPDQSSKYATLVDIQMHRKETVVVRQTEPSMWNFTSRPRQPCKLLHYESLQLLQLAYDLGHNTSYTGCVVNFSLVENSLFLSL